MFSSIIRIALLAGLVFGGYKLYPRLKPAIQPLLSNSTVLGTANNLLPENLKIPTNKPTSDNPNSSQAKSREAGSGSAGPDLASPENSANWSNLTNSVIDEVKQKAGQAAQDQIDAVKKETGAAFCAALVETIKKQCGLNN